MTFEQHTSDSTRTASPIESSRLHRYGLAVVLLLFTGLTLLYDVTVPFFEKPDELKHFAVVQFVQANEQLPVVRAGVYKPWDQEGTQPPLYYLLAAAATGWLNLDDFQEPPRNPHYADDRSFVWRERGNNNLYLHSPGENWRTAPIFLAARLTRWLSLLAGLSAITLTYILAQVIFTPIRRPIWPAGKSDRTGFTKAASALRLTSAIPLLAAALMAFVPQYLHVSSAITNDSLTVTLAAAGLVVLALMIRDGLSTRRSLVLGLVLGLGAITKLSLLYLVPVAGLVFLLEWYRRRSLLALLKYGAIVAALMLLLSGWWFWRNWQLYGDPTALSAHLLYRGGVLDPTPSLAEIWQTEMTGLELSFWAAFGAGQILLEPVVYRGLGWLKYLVLAGLLIGLVRMDRRQKTETGKTASTVVSLGLLVLWCGLIFVALLRWMQITPASWGRLLYPALPALAVLSAWALVQFPLLSLTLHTGAAASSPAKAVSVIFRLTLWVIPALVPGALFGLSVLGALRYIPAAYAKAPLLAESALPAGIERLDLTIKGDGDDSLRLIGYRVEQPTVHPGEWLPVTLYWQAAEPVAKNYSAFVHLLNPQGQSIGQSNSYPDSGNWPTSLLPPGQILADRHYIRLPLDVAAPAETRLSMGLFDFDDPERAAKPAFNSAGEPVVPIVAGPPLLPREWPRLEPSQNVNANFAGQIRLIGFDPVDEIAHPGETIPLTLYWEALAPPGQNLNLFIHLIDSATQSHVAGFDGPPHFGTAYWPPGARIIDRRSLALPPDLPPGEYTVLIGWYNLDNFARLPLLPFYTTDSLHLTELAVK